MISTFIEDLCFLVKYIAYESFSGSSIAFCKKLGPMNILFKNWKYSQVSDGILKMI